MIGGRASVSAEKLYDFADPCSCPSSYMTPQSNADFIILNGPLVAGSVLSPSFPVFILHFYYLKNASRLSISYFKVQHSTPYVANGLINFYTFYFFPLSNV